MAIVMITDLLARRRFNVPGTARIQLEPTAAHDGRRPEQPA
jgi:hypothetical protein